MGKNEDLDLFIDDNIDEFIDDLFTLLAQPSISATGDGLEDCCTLIEEMCYDYLFDDVRVVEGPGHSAIIGRAFANHDPANEKPTLLIYGHYDVQPVDASAWETPPFEPTIRNGPDGDSRIYARGSGDNKGQFFAHLCAIKAWRKVRQLPINVTLLLEGEEESGSHHFQQIVHENADVLNADFAYNADGPMERENRPEIILGTRGLLSVQIACKGPNRDLHSGNFGGPIPNPAWELVQLISSMREPHGKVSIEGFYEDVKKPTKTELHHLDNIPFDDEEMKSDVGVDNLTTGPGDSYWEKLLFYPTLNIAGFNSGYSGEGIKTIIPSEAIVKLDLRLVEHQDPDDIFKKLERHVDQNASDLLDINLTRLGSMKPLRISPDDKLLDSVIQAVEEAWGVEPFVKPSAAGAGPYKVLEEELDLQYVAVPYGNTDENNHSPNENLKVAHFKNGIRTSARVLGKFSP